MRKKRSVPAAWSMVTTWTSSWFMIVFIRSFAGIVSKAKLSGAIWIPRKLRGTDAGARVAGVGEVGEEHRHLLRGAVVEHPPLEAHRVLEGAPGVRDQERLAALRVDEAEVLRLEAAEDLGAAGEGGGEQQHGRHQGQRRPGQA